MVFALARRDRNIIDAGDTKLHQAADGPADASWLDRDEKAAIASRHRSDGVAVHSDIRVALKDWRVFGIGLVGIGVIFCITGVQLWVPQIVQAMGFPNETVGVVVALPFVCATAAMILWGYASDSRRERIWHIASAALFTALGLIIASISTSHLLVLLGLTIAIVGQFSALPVINTLLPSLLRGPALLAESPSTTPWRSSADFSVRL
jgi:MFS transporter, ACS family, tartrate transporter